MIKFLFISFLIVAFVPPVRRFVFWLFVGRKLMKEQRWTNESAPFSRSQKSETVVSEKKDIHFKGGEYVDFEEIK